MKLSEILKKYREDNKLSQREFAKKCELSNSLISILEMGKNPQTGKAMEPDLRTYRRLASGMGMTERELLQKVRGDSFVAVVRGNRGALKGDEFASPNLRIQSQMYGISGVDAIKMTVSDKTPFPGGVVGKVETSSDDPELNSLLKLWKVMNPERKKDVVRIAKAMTEEE